MMDKVKLDYELKIDYAKLFHPTWQYKLHHLLKSNYMYNIMAFIHELYNSSDFPRPSKSVIFEAFKKVPLPNVQVVILTDEPINNIQGNGIAFATKESMLLKPSMITEAVEKCIERSIYGGCRPGFDLTLEHWLNQGVLPIHASLTTRFLKKGSHIKLWGEFTRTVIKTLDSRPPGLIFILLGDEAKKFKPLISETNHYVLEYYAPVVAVKQKLDWKCPCFKRANDILISNNGHSAAIEW
mgnify:CR=1 FL=1|jgi:uracil-DNA glycosylase|tara:strand:+ start:11348 stop:12067 length:720 start_codon:yes stop_codon:yes gene_type:complete